MTAPGSRNEMAVKKYDRSISFPAPKPATTAAGGDAPMPLTPNQRAAIAKTSYRTRSASLPTRLHSLSAHLDSDLTALRDWTASSSSSPPSSAAFLADGIALLHLLLGSLPDLLLLPQAQDPLCRHARRVLTSSCSPSSVSFADRLLEDFLRLADAHGCFRSAALDLKHHLSDTRAALRRTAPSGDPSSQLSSCLRAQRRAEREVARLAAMVRDVGRRLPVLAAAADAEEAEVAGVLREVVTVSAAASVAVFNGVAAVSAASVAAAPARRTWVEAALMHWWARAKASSAMKKRVQSVEEKEKVGGVEAALRQWLARAKAAIKKRSLVADEKEKKKVSVEAALLRWLARAKARSNGSTATTNGSTASMNGSTAVIKGSAAKEKMVMVDEERREEEEAKDVWRRAAVHRLAALEDGVAALESGTEVVFRALVNTRVALLNILTPAI